MPGREYKIDPHEGKNPGLFAKPRDFSVSIPVTLYRNGAEIEWPFAKRKPPGGKRGEIGNMSPKARRRAAFAFGNAETDWLAMATLTYRDCPESERVKSDLAKFRKRFLRRWDQPDWGWIMEFTRRGIPHFHVFLGNGGPLGRAIEAAPTEARKRHGRPIEIIRGEVDEFFVDSWLAITGDESAGRIRFMKGGIVERMRSPDAAGRYVAKEAGKRCQKILPAKFKKGLGRYWFLARHIRPIPRGQITIEPSDYPETNSYRYLWDSSKIRRNFAKA